MEVETSLSSSVSLRHVDLGPLNLFGRVDSDCSEEVTDLSDSSSTNSTNSMVVSRILLVSEAFCPVDQ